MAFSIIVIFIGAYLLGSINFAIIFTSAFTDKDVREYGSFNAGATNTLRVAGVLPGVLAFLGDVLKGFAACGIGILCFKYMYNNSLCGIQPIIGAYLCGVCCFIGHLFPVFFQFRGGKGVAVCVGIFLICCTKAIIIGLLVFALMVVITRIVSVSSLSATLITVIMSIVFGNQGVSLLPQCLCAIFMGGAIFIKHSNNIKQLLAGNEKKITFKRNKNG